MVARASTGGLQVDFNENFARKTSASYNIDVRSLGGCWTCTTITMVCLGDMKTYAAVALHSRNT